MSNFSSVFIFSNYYLEKLDKTPIYYCFSSIWRIEKLIQELDKIEKFNFDNNNGFLEINSKTNLDFRLNDISEFFINRYISLYNLYKNKKISKSDELELKNNILAQLLNYNIPVTPEASLELMEMLNSKTMMVNNKKMKLHSSINFPEGKYLFNLIKKNRFKNILEIGMAYGISAMFMVLGLKNNKIDDSQLISIDPSQSTYWNSIGLYNIKRIKGEKYHKLMEDKSYIILPKLLEDKRKFNLVFIDGWHTFDYTLIDVFYSILLVEVNGYIIIDDILHPGVMKTIKYIDTNYSDMLKKINSPVRTIGIYQN